jgi:hypothetical protein
MSGMGCDFFLMNFVAALGVLQMAASYASLRGILFLRHRALSGILGFLAVVGAFLWFFISEPRNLPDTGGGLSGNEDAWLFCAAGACAILFTLAATSVLNRRMGREYASRRPGLDALEHTTFYRAFLSAVRGLWTRS